MARGEWSMFSISRLGVRGRVERRVRDVRGKGPEPMNAILEIGEGEGDRGIEVSAESSRRVREM